MKKMVLEEILMCVLDIDHFGNFGKKLCSNLKCIQRII